MANAKIHDRVSVGVRQLYSRQRDNARARNKFWDLTIEEFSSFLFDNCFYCGVGPSNSYPDRAKGEPPLRYSGLDRVDNSIGYVTGNIVSCCSQCNKGKHVMTAEEFLDWVSRVQNHQELVNG